MKSLKIQKTKDFLKHNNWKFAEPQRIFILEIKRTSINRTFINLATRVAPFCDDTHFRNNKAI